MSIDISKITIGTVSHGTLRPEDLAAAFLQHARFLGIDVPEELAKDAEAIANDTYLDEDAAEVMIELGDLIDDGLPSYLRFGTHEGDASDWGVFGDERYSEELIDALLGVDEAAEGDSSDGEIAALRLALDLALGQLRDQD